MDGVAILESEVRELIRRRGVDPVRDRPAITALVSDAMADYDQRSILGSVPPLVDAGAAHKALVDAVSGLGPLQRYLDDPEVEEIWINSPAKHVCAGQRVNGRRKSAHGPPSLRPVSPRVGCRISSSGGTIQTIRTSARCSRCDARQPIYRSSNTDLCHILNVTGDFSTCRDPRSGWSTGLNSQKRRVGSMTRRQMVTPASRLRAA